MKYIHELIESIDNPSIRITPTEYPNEGQCYSYKQEQIPCSWYLQIGKLTLSIQCGEYNYADYYERENRGYQMRGSEFRYTHPSTRTAEVGIFETSSDKWVNFGEGAILVGAYQTISDIQDVINVLLEYAGDKADG